MSLGNKVQWFLGQSVGSSSLLPETLLRLIHGVPMLILPFLQTASWPHARPRSLPLTGRLDTGLFLPAGDYLTSLPTSVAAIQTVIVSRQLKHLFGTYF